MTDLGSLKRLDPRTAWQHEARNFTPWLADHLEQLGQVLGLDLEFVRRESDAGDFSIDILARDLGRDRLVVIENQLAVTDHTHLGQIITYAAEVDAGSVVWLCREFRDEHRQALDWLNRKHGEGTTFFGVVLELLQIDDSKPAINLRLVAAPVNWNGSVSEPGSDEEVSERRRTYKTFFQRLIDTLRDKHHFTNARIGQPQNWYSFASGVSGVQYSASFASNGRVRAELYIDKGDRDENLALIRQLKQDQAQIEKDLGSPIEWDEIDGKRACRIAVYRPGSIEDAQDKLDEHLTWLVDRLLTIKRVFSKRITTIDEARE